MQIKRKPYKSYEEGLSKRLSDHLYAIDYLNAVLQGPEAELSTFLLAVADVAKASGFTKKGEINMKKKSVEEEVNEALQDLGEIAYERMKVIKQTHALTEKLSLDEWSHLARLMRPFRRD